MQGAPEIKGWCPGALTPMESGDGLLLRAKIVGSKLSLTQVSEIAAIALDCGNGRIDLSQRAQLQIRGVSETTLAAAQARLKSIGLLALDAATESRLNIVASPLANSASFDANEIAARLARAIAEDQALESLPGKFLFLVDDGSAPGLRDVGADIRLEARGAQFAVVLDGARDQAVIASASRGDRRRGRPGARLHPIARGAGVRIASDARLGRRDGRRAVAARLRAHV